MSRPFITREFMPVSFEEQIHSNVNGNINFSSKFHDPRKLINIFVSAEGLRTTKLFSRTDPLCVLSTIGPHGWHEYGRTEVCWNILNPLWIRPFTLDTESETPQHLHFEVYNIISNNYNLQVQDLLGEARIELVSLLTSPTHSISLEISSPTSHARQGYLHIHYFPVEPVYGCLFFKMSARELHYRKRKVAPFFVIKRLAPLSHDFVAVYKSAVHSKTHAADWDRIELSLQFLCSGDIESPIRISVFDYKLRDNDNFLGFFDTTVDQLMSQHHNVFDIVSEKGKTKGKFEITFVDQLQCPILSDFRLQGLTMQASFAIDFSSTRIDSIHTNKLQHMDDSIFSYMQAINDTADLLMTATLGQPYEAVAFSDTLMPFPGDTLIPTPKTLLRQYDQMRHHHNLYAPKAFLLPVLQRFVESARQKWEDRHTVSLLAVLTNGIFDDLNESIDFLVENESAPIVVLFVVLGGIKREINLRMKHCHGRLVDSKGKRCTRRVVKMALYMDGDMGRIDMEQERLRPKLLKSLKKAIREFVPTSNWNPFEHRGQGLHREPSTEIFQLPAETQPHEVTEPPPDLVTDLIIFDQ